MESTGISALVTAAILVVVMKCGDAASSRDFGRPK